MIIVQGSSQFNGLSKMLIGMHCSRTLGRSKCWDVYLGRIWPQPHKDSSIPKHWAGQQRCAFNSPNVILTCALTSSAGDISIGSCDFWSRSDTIMPQSVWDTDDVLHCSGDALTYLPWTGNDHAWIECLHLLRCGVPGRGECHIGQHSSWPVVG